MNQECIYVLYGSQTGNAKEISKYIYHILHRPKRKIRQNAVITYIFYNYVSSNLLNVFLLFYLLIFLLLLYKLCFKLLRSLAYF